MTRATALASRWRSISLVVVPIVAGLALLASLVAVVVSINSAGTRAVDVARQVTPEVTRQVIAESRGQRALDGRRLLTEANAANASRGLPVVADPSAVASADEVIGAWLTARVLGALPPTVTDELAAQVADGRTPRVLPSFAPAPGSDGDIVVTVLPEDGPSGSGPRTASPPRGDTGGSSGGGGSPGTATRPPAPSRPAPVPPSRGGGLLRPCLLGAVLC